MTIFYVAHWIRDVETDVLKGAGLWVTRTTIVLALSSNSKDSGSSHIFFFRVGVPVWYLGKMVAVATSLFLTCLSLIPWCSTPLLTATQCLGLPGLSGIIFGKSLPRYSTMERRANWTDVFFPPCSGFPFFPSVDRILLLLASLLMPSTVWPRVPPQRIPRVPPPLS